MKIGIDIIENKRIKLKDSFIQKVLSSNEITLLQKRPKELKKQFISGRWAVKEAIIKILDEPILMNVIDIDYMNSKPFITNKGFENIYISISHEKKFSVGVAMKQNDQINLSTNKK